MNSFISQLRRRFNTLTSKKPGRTRKTSLGFKWRRACLRVDELENRLVPSAYFVNTLMDPSIAAGVNNANGRIVGTSLVSLRSAIEAANNTPGNNFIILTLRGVYKIQQVGAGEDLNQTGDFDIVPNFPTSGNSTLSIVNMSFGTVAIDGNHLDRVFDINPGVLASGTGSTFTVAMTGFTIQGGVVSDPVDPDGGNASGGGIRDQGNVNLKLTRMVVTNNRATADGAGIGMVDDALSGGSWILTINSSIITNNHTGDAGGGIDTDGGGTVMIANSVISRNTDINQGGGVYIDVAMGTDPGTVGADMIMTRTLVDRNQALAPSTTDGQGGSGGGISNAGTGTMTISNSVISNNFAAGSGGGFDDENGFGTLLISNSTFSNNSAVLDGGAIHESANINPTMISNTTFSVNFAGGGGGGFSNNPNGVANPTAGNVDFENSLFLDNSAAGNGGAIQALGPVTTIHNTEMKFNTAGGAGGGVFAGGTTLAVNAVTIADNTASAGGGGIELQTTGTGVSRSTIVDATIAFNSAVVNAVANGGGIEAPAAFAGDVFLLNDTINDNFATNGGGISWAGGGSFTVQNTIIAQNFATTAGTDVMNAAGTFTDLGNNLIGVNDATGFTAGTTLSGVDPRLGPLGNNGGPKVGAAGSAITLETERLLPGSPAIGAGNASAAPPRDERGFPSVVNGRANIGAVSQALFG